MIFFRKNFLSIITLLAFFSIIAVEDAHHHGSFESNDNCSLCSFQQTASHAPSIPLPPALFPFVVVFAVVVFFSIFTRAIVTSARGRSPPVLL